MVHVIREFVYLFVKPEDLSPAFVMKVSADIWNHVYFFICHDPHSLVHGKVLLLGLKCSEKAHFFLCHIPPKNKKKADSDDQILNINHRLGKFHSILNFLLQISVFLFTFRCGIFTINVLEKMWLLIKNG